MTRGTFANVRIKNLMLAGEEGGNTLYFAKGSPAGEKLSILRRGRCNTATRAPRWSSSPARNTAPVIRAIGRPRAPHLLGVKAVVAQSFERIHRSNLVGMGVLPLQFKEGTNAADPWNWTAPRPTTSSAWMRISSRSRT